MKVVKIKTGLLKLMKKLPNLVKTKEKNQLLKINKKLKNFG